MPDPVSSVATAISELAKAISKWLSGATSRRSRKAIDAGESYIRRNNKLGRKPDKKLDKYEKIFFANNQ